MVRLRFLGCFFASLFSALPVFLLPLSPCLFSESCPLSSLLSSLLSPCHYSRIGQEEGRKEDKERTRENKSKGERIETENEQERTNKSKEDKERGLYSARGGQGRQGEGEGHIYPIFGKGLIRGNSGKIRGDQNRKEDKEGGERTRERESSSSERKEGRQEEEQGRRTKSPLARKGARVTNKESGERV